MDLCLLLLAAVGHAFFWIGAVNRLHAMGIQRRWVDSLTWVFFVSAASLPTAVLVWFLVKGVQRPMVGFQSGGAGAAAWAFSAYCVVCWAVAAATLVRFAWFRFRHRTPSLVRFYGKRRAEIDLSSAAAVAEDDSHHWLARLPLNEILHLEVCDWAIEMPRLAAGLDGLSIVHLSDFHLTGRVGKAFFCEVVRTSNELEPDLVALTGDLVDARECIDWLPDTLGQLRAKHGVYFILGNHDLLTRDVDRLRATLTNCGLIDVGSQPRTVEIAGESILLLGNQRPWIRLEGALAAGLAADKRALRILLSHSPDQLAWARGQGVDLMLAGHTHGGQIRIPPLGPIFSPSLWGVKHIAGIYDASPTILHVTRGISGCTPARWLCRPEVSRLRLKARARG